MDDSGEKAHRLRRIALRDLLTHAQVAQRPPLAGLGADRTDHGAGPGDEIDVANEYLEATTSARLIEHRWSSHAVLDDALERFRLGLYGVCEECDEEISMERLRVLPFATYCVDCQRQRERKRAVEGYGNETLVSISGNEPPVHNSDESEVTRAEWSRRPKIRPDSMLKQIGPTRRKHTATTRG